MNKSSSFFPPLIAATSQRGLRRDLPKSHPRNYDISAGLSFPSMRFQLAARKRSSRRQPRRQEWITAVGAMPTIEPGSPWENGYIDSFNARRTAKRRDGPDSHRELPPQS